MQRKTVSRRTTLSVAAGSVLAGIGVATANDGSDGSGGNDDSDGEITRESFAILEGTERETTVSVTTAAADGPTVLVVGGVHGNEVAGYDAANEIRDWSIDAGTLVTIPEANAVAIERETRTDDEDVDLNRQFPEDADPETELARALWDVVVEYDPDIVVDLHESTGIYAGDPVDGVGQAIFRSDSDEASSSAADAVEYVNRNYVDDPALEFQTGPFSGPNSDPQGLLVHKAARDLGADAFLVETLSTNHDLETRVQWHTAIVERLVDDLFSAEDPDDGGVPDEPGEDEQPVDDGDEDEQPVDDDDQDGDEDEQPVDDGDEDEQPVDEDDDQSDEDDDEPADDGSDAPTGDAPIAQIELDVDESALEAGQTVTLDASSSTPNDGIVCYEWDVGADGCFEHTGETIEVTISADGDHSVLLRVTDAAGATATEEFTLSTL